MTMTPAEKLKMNTIARVVAATLALVAVIYTVNFYLVKAKTDQVEREFELIYDRLDKLEDHLSEIDDHLSEVEDEVKEPKKKGAAK